MSVSDLTSTIARALGRGPRLVGCLFAGLALAALPACTTSNIPDPKYPVYMQDKPADSVVVAEPEAAAPVVTTPPSAGGITTAELAPPPPPPPPANTVAAAVTPVAPAPVKDTGAAWVYVMVAQDTLYGVSRRFGVPVKTIYDINGFEPDAILRVGQKVLLPATASDKGAEPRANGATFTRLSTALASTVPSSPAPSQVAKPATTPAVKPLSSSLPPPTVPKPAPAKPPVTSVVTATVPVATAAVPKPPVIKTPVTTPAPKPPVTKPVPTPPISGFPTNAQLTQMGRGLFAWPVKGKVLVPFGQLAPNVRNDGINIASTSGTEVLAAADGVVVYQGDQVKELGNTIYVKHPGGWYTGYSHLSGMKVTNNQKITMGQVIGTVGQSGTIDQPQLHFEVRYTPSTDIARPIDPKLVLP